MDLEDEYALAGFRKVTDLKYVNPKLKVTLAIGGWNEGSTKYSEMARDAAKRKTFVQSVTEFLKQHNFDGLDLDWEYPGKIIPHFKRIYKYKITYLAETHLLNF